MVDTVRTLKTPDPVTSFLSELHELGPVAWAAISLAAHDREAGLWEWDGAYQAALDAGGGWAAEVAARAADEVQGGLPAAALVAGAAAALSARQALSPVQFDLLYGPVAEVLPRAVRGRLAAASVRPVYTTCMPNSTSSSETRPLPA
jgi:hypothetical protein